MLVKQESRARVLIDEPADFRDVTGAGLPHYVLHRATTVALNYNRAATWSIGTRPLKRSAMRSYRYDPAPRVVLLTTFRAFGARHRRHRENDKTSSELVGSGMAI